MTVLKTWFYLIHAPRVTWEIALIKEQNRWQMSVVGHHSSVDKVVCKNVVTVQVGSGMRLSPTKWLTNTHDAQVSLAGLRQMHPLRWLPIDCCHPLCAAMTTSTGLSIPWCSSSMIYDIFLCDDCHPLFIVVWSSAAYHDDRHGQTMIACVAWRLTVRAPGIRRGYRPAPSLWE